ncbi:MAG: hypothetical protein Q9210_005237, partial [Variospora velana]
SLREDLIAAFESEGRARKLMTDTPTGHVFNFSTFPFQADMLQRFRNVRDSKSAYRQVAGFCIISVYQVFFEQAQPWAAIAAITGSLPPPQRAAELLAHTAFSVCFFNPPPPAEAVFLKSTTRIDYLTFHGIYTQGGQATDSCTSWTLKPLVTYIQLKLYGNRYFDRYYIRLLGFLLSDLQ